MPIERELKSAAMKVREDYSHADRVALEAIFAIGILLGGGYTYAACLVLALVEDAIGKDHPDLVETRRKLGVQDA